MALLLLIRGAVSQSVGSRRLAAGGRPFTVHFTVCRLALFGVFMVVWSFAPLLVLVVVT